MVESSVESNAKPSEDQSLNGPGPSFIYASSGQEMPLYYRVPTDLTTYFSMNIFQFSMTISLLDFRI